jgi:hypothetical protein
VPATDVTCVVHAHSVHSDGTGTVEEIAAQAARADVDVVLLTDHDSLDALRRGAERYHGPVLVCVGEEVSPRDGNHYLAFGIDEEIDHAGLTGAEIVAAVAEAGGFGFLAHPFSRGSARFRRVGPGMPWDDLDAPGYTGIELWSFVTDTVEGLASVRDIARFVARPERGVTGPPEGNLRGWDALLARRSVVAIGGVDAHQIGVRVAGRVPLRLMSYRRSFSHLRTHVLLDRPRRGEAQADRDAVYAALRAGSCYLAMDSFGRADGFAFTTRGTDAVPMGGEAQWADGQVLEARVPQPAELTLVRDGERVARVHGTMLEHAVERPGVYRLEARLHAQGAWRTWILSNPVYLR